MLYDLQVLVLSTGIGAVVGAPLGSLVADKMGRKYSLMFSGLPLVVGWFMIIMSGNFVVMVIGRFLTGLSTSMGYMLPPLYISEIASKVSDRCIHRCMLA